MRKKLWLSLGAPSRGPINPWIEIASYREKLVPHVTFGYVSSETWPVVSCGRWHSVYDRVSRMPAYTASPRAKLVSERYWRSLVLDNGTLERRDRPLRLCVLRRRGSEPETRWAGEWRPLPKQQPSRGARW